jgi:hypothetical protein
LKLADDVIAVAIAARDLACLSKREVGMIEMEKTEQPIASVSANVTNPSQAAN